jgi:hypothetical protein
MEFRGVVDGHDECWWGRFMGSATDGACRYPNFGQVEQIGVQHK